MLGQAAAVDPVRKRVYMTEDVSNGCFYRFKYSENSLSSGTLQVAKVSGTSVTWADVPDRDVTPRAPAIRSRELRASTAVRVPSTNGFVYFTTKGDNRVWRYDCVDAQLTVIYDDNTSCNPVLTGVVGFLSDVLRYVPYP